MSECKTGKVPYETRADALRDAKFIRASNRGFSRNSSASKANRKARVGNIDTPFGAYYI